MLPSLPNDGLCSIATQSGDHVNLRAGPSSNDDVIGTMDPSQTYTAVAISADGQWYQMKSGGWAAGWVTRQDNECQNLGSEPSEPADEPEPAHDQSRLPVSRRPH